MYFLLWEKQQWDCLLFPEFLKINKNILLIFEFEKTHISENNIDIKHNSANNWNWSMFP